MCWGGCRVLCATLSNVGKTVGRTAEVGMGKTRTLSFTKTCLHHPENCVEPRNTLIPHNLPSQQRRVIGIKGEVQTPPGQEKQGVWGKSPPPSPPKKKGEKVPP
jgi:hypothetical protein